MEGAVAGVTEHPRPTVGDTGQLAARSAADGTPVWQAEDSFVPEPEGIRALGPDELSAPGYVYSGGPYADRETTFILTMSSGAAVATLDARHVCVDDAEATIVCDSGSHVVGLDRGSGTTLWELPDQAAGRIAPTVHTARRGVVYTFAGNGPVILDARTGADKVTDLAITPDHVVPGYGLVLEDDEDQHRPGVRSTISELERALGAPPSSGTDDWAAVVGVQHEHLRVAFDRHVASAEGEGGPFENMIHDAPRLVRRVEKLRDDHTALTAELTALAQRLDEPIAVVREVGTTLLGHLAYEAYNVEIDAAD